MEGVDPTDIDPTEGSGWGSIPDQSLDVAPVPSDHPARFRLVLPPSFRPSRPFAPITVGRPVREEFCPLRDVCLTHS